MATDMSLEAQEALASVKRASLVKKMNEESWSDHMEFLLKSWGEKAAGLRFIHNASAGKWKKFSNQLTLTGIAISSISSAVSLVAASIDDDEIKNSVLYAVGGVGLVASLIQSIKKFYNSEEKAAEHAAIAKQFGSFYRFMTLQLGMSRADRQPADQLSEFVLKEYERLQQDSPPVGAGEIALYKKVFKGANQAVPDICEDSFEIQVYTSTTVEDLD
jgi:multidrug transporter EmrE-like cation transporter